MISNLVKAPPRSVVGNALMLFSARGLLVVLSLVSTPVLLHRLGIQAFGIYVLALTLGGLLALFDLGLTPAVVSFLSHAQHEGDDKASQRILSTAFTSFLAIGILGGLGMLALVPWLVSGLLHVPLSLRDQAIVALDLSTLGFALNMWLGAFSVVPMALERYDLIASRTIGLGVVATILIIAWALHGGGIEGLMVINVGAATASIAVFAAVSRRLLPGLRFRPGFDAATFRGLARFGVVKFAGTLGGILTFRFDQFAIGALIGLGSVGFYAIPANLTWRVQSVLAELTSPLFPRASKLRSDLAATRSLFLAASRAMALVSAPILVTLFVYADLVLLYWIGGLQGRLVADQASWTMRWLLAAFLIQAVAAVPSIFCEAQGKPEINNSFAVGSALIHVPLVLLLVPRLGIAGAAVALLLNGSVQTVAFIIVASRRIAHVGAVELLQRAIARPLVAAMIYGAAAVALRPLIHGRLSLAAALLATPVLFSVCAVLVSITTGEDLGYIVAIAERLPVWLPGRRAVLRSVGAHAGG